MGRPGGARPPADSLSMAARRARRPEGTLAYGRGSRRMRLQEGLKNASRKTILPRSWKLFSLAESHSSMLISPCLKIFFIRSALISAQ